MTIASRTIPEAHSYASYQNAEKKVLSVIKESGLKVVRYLIVAQPNGRFTPTVIKDEMGNHFHYFINKKIAVVG